MKVWIVTEGFYEDGPVGVFTSAAAADQCVTVIENATGFRTGEYRVVGPLTVDEDAALIVARRRACYGC